MADEPSDACSRTNEDNGRARRRASDAYPDGNGAVRIGRRKKYMKPYLTSCFGTVVAILIYVLADEEMGEDDDTPADLLEKATECLAAVKAWIVRELGPDNDISEEILGGFQEIPDSQQDDESECL